VARDKWCLDRTSRLLSMLPALSTLSRCRARFGRRGIVAAVLLAQATEMTRRADGNGKARVAARARR
jgi:hypothetical protein